MIVVLSPSLTPEKLSPEQQKVIQIYQQADKAKQSGNYQEAVRLYEQTVTLAQKAFGPENINTAILLNNLAELYLKMRRAELSLSFSQRAMDIAFKNTIDSFSIASETQKLDLVEKNKCYQDILLSTVSALSGNLDAVNSGLTSAFRFKGIVLEAMLGEQEVLRRGLSAEAQRT